MIKYNVNLFREMRLYFPGIEADSPDAAARIASGTDSCEADDEAEDCNGQDLGAMVDVAGDEDFSRSVTIDFERHRKAAATFLSTLKAVAELRRKWRSQDEAETIDSIEYMDGLDSLGLDDVIAQAEAGGIRPAPATPRLLDALQSVLPYAENEAYALEKLKDSPEAEAEAERAWKAVETAQALLAEAKASGIDPANFDIHALLAERRQIAAVWSVEDVQAVRPGLTDEQAWDVLQQAGRRHDAEIGIHWDVLRCVADDIGGAAPDTDEPEEA